MASSCRVAASSNIQSGEKITVNYNGEPDILDDPGFKVLD